VALAVVAGGFLGGYLASVFVLFPSQGSATDLITVPELVGREGEGARELLIERGLEYVEATALHHPEAPVGTVVAQSPLPGQMSRPGASVRVTLSLGARQRAVPDVEGLSQRQAEIVMERAGFRTDVSRVDAEAEVGEVVSTEPAAGTEVRLPSRVHLLVSAGPPRVEVPDLANRSLSEAQAMVERLGLRLGSVERDWASQAAPGTVIGQAPSAGRVVDRGRRISVTVAAVPPVEPGDTSSRGGAD
jgi:serine/threonine-protein kinase